MKHEMKLHPKYYNFILNGTKRLEIRLFDEKENKLKLAILLSFQKFLI